MARRKFARKLEHVQKLVQAGNLAGVEPEVIQRILDGDIAPTPTPFTDMLASISKANP